MDRKHHPINVTCKKGVQPTVDPMSQTMALGDTVSWILTPDSDPGSSAEIRFDGASGFTQFGLSQAGLTVIPNTLATEPNPFSYTVVADDGEFIDPIIVVDPPPVE